MRRTLIFTLLAVLATGGPGAVLLACGDTAGKRVSFETVAVSEATVFTNSLGWTITLDEATLAAGPLYYFGGAAEHARRSVLMRRALAHPGHYVAGDALGEMTTPATIDLLTANLLPRGRGVTGTLRSARMGFDTSQPTRVVRILAHASKGADTVYFHATAGVDQIADHDRHPQVDSCVFREADVQRDGTVTVTIKPSVWMDKLALDGVTGDLAAHPGAYTALASGLKDSRAYVFSYEAK